MTPDDHYYPNTTCHHCHNLQYYLLNITKYFTSNTQLLFLPGLHHLHTDLIIQNVHNISLIGSSANGTTLDTIIKCTRSVGHGILMTNIVNLTVKHLIVQDCKVNRMLSDDIYPYDQLYSSVLITDCKDIVINYTSVDTTLIGINILGISHLHNVSCNKIYLRYTEIQTQKRHHTLLIDYFQTLNDFIFEDIVVLSMRQLSYKVTIQLSNTVIQDEVEIFMVVNYMNHMSMLVFKNCKFYHNYAELFVFSSLLLRSHDRITTIHFTNCLFLHNSTPHSLITIHVIRLIIVHCLFYTNSRVLEIQGSSSTLASAIIKNTTFSFSTLREFTFKNYGEETFYSKYEEIVQVKHADLFLIGPVIFSNNNGYNNSIVSLRGNSTLTTVGLVNFSNNNVSALINFSRNDNQYISVNESSVIKFSQNQVCTLFQIETFKPIPYPHCFFQYRSTSTARLDKNIKQGNFSIRFDNNKYNRTESNCSDEIPITKCHWIPYVQSTFKDIIPLDVNKQYIQYNNNSDIASLSIKQSTLCICIDEIHHDCHISEVGYLYPGQTLSLFLYHISEQHDKYDSVFEVIVKTDIDLPYIKPCTVLNISEHQQLVYTSCTKVEYAISFSTSASVWCELLLKLKSDSPDTVNVFYVRKLKCPPGFAEINKVCQCDPAITNFKMISCDINDQTILRPANSWISATTHNNSYTYHISLHCPFHYCLPHSSHLNFSTPNSQCQFNRSGLLCGHCQQGLGTVFSSSHCKTCSDYYLFLIIPIIVVGFILVLLLFLLNLTVTDGAVNGFILYANIISINTPILFPNVNHFTPTYTFISLANLDLGIQTCFYNGMDEYAKMWLQLAFPFYLIFIATLIIITSRYSTKIQRLTARRALPVLATLFLLSYTKILRIVSSVLFFYSTITHLPSKHTTLVWSVDANVPLFGVRFTILFIVCLILFLILIPFNVILLFTRTLSRFRFINKFKPLLDAYQGPYKDRVYFWNGLQLLLRAIFFGLSSLDRNINLTTSAILLGVFGGISGAMSPYKNKYKSFQEIIFIFNLQGLYIMLLHNRNALNMTIINTMITMAAVHFIFIITYHVITYMFGGVIRNKILLSVNTFIEWITRLRNKSQPQQFQLHNDLRINIPEVAFNYREYREPLIGHD